MFHISELTPSQTHLNPSYDELYHAELEHTECVETSLGALCVNTSPYTGRSPKDKFIVEQSETSDAIWWGEVNQKISECSWLRLKELAYQELSGKELYLTQCFCGADKKEQLAVEVITELAWQAHFCKNMFISPEESELNNFLADFTILNACLTDASEDWQELGLNSSTFVVFNLREKMAIIGGTRYGGEMKKGIFSVMNFLLPERNILPMHCSANISNNGKSNIFFGLSGTGKTTLSADPQFQLIGDDEHGWNDNGVFNFEGGCYAKVIKLRQELEPDIYNAIRRNALLENVLVDSKGNVDFDDDSITQNTRVSYPLNHIDNIAPNSRGPHPQYIIFLTCDAFGVLPPVAKLTAEQSSYYFISGYTAKVAGTERGIKEPVAAFSPCFGGPFLTRHPQEYAALLQKKCLDHKVPVFMVNTGWIGGSYGTGERIALPITRQIIHAIISGELDNCDYRQDEIFQLSIPLKIDGVEASSLSQEELWQDKEAYLLQAKKLQEMFVENYHQYQ